MARELPSRAALFGPQKIKRLAIAFAIIALSLTANAGQGGSLQFKRIAITLPAPTIASQMCRFEDIDGDGLFDLLTVDPADHRLLVYRQKSSGFGASPDQIVGLPAQTAWLAVSDVASHPGMELVMSTAGGVDYLQQNGGVFESQPRNLIRAHQVFTSGAAFLLTSLDHDADGTNAVIPIISAGQVVLYKRNDAFEWSAGPAKEFETRRTFWFTNRSDWMMGPNPSWNMVRQDVFRANPDENLTAAKKAENESLKKFFESAEKESEWHLSGIERLDLNRDGREDAVAWLVAISGAMDVRTDLLVFLRGADQQLPARPTQVLHCQGIPVTGPKHHASPLCDLKGDGRSELVLVVLKTGIRSASGIVDALVSGSVEWDLTIRDFNGSAFSRSPDQTLVITTIGSTMDLPADRILIEGDFNGDGRPDILSQQVNAQWRLQLSSTRGDWFSPQTAATFEIPSAAHFQYQDLNHDGLADLIALMEDQPQVLIFLSDPDRAKSSRP